MSRFPLFLSATMFLAIAGAVAIGTSTTYAAITVSPGTLTSGPASDTFTITINFADGNKVCHGQAGGGLSGPCDWDPGVAGEQAIVGGAGVSITINGGNGDDTIVYDDSAAPGGYAGVYVVAVGVVNSFYVDIVASGVEKFEVNGSEGTDWITVESLPAAVTLSVNLKGGSDTFTLGAAGGLSALQGGIDIQGGLGTSDKLELHDDVETTGRGFVIEDGKVTRGGGFQMLYDGLDILHIEAGSGGDTIGFLSANPATTYWLVGNFGADTITGGSSVDEITGGPGADILAGGLGADSIDGGSGADVITWLAGDGDDSIDGGSGPDTLNIIGDALQEQYIVQPVMGQPPFAARAVDVEIGFRVLRDIGSGTIDPVRGVELLHMETGGEVDEVILTPLEGTVIDVDGGPPGPSPRDSLVVERKCFAHINALNPPPGIIATPGYQNISHQGFELLNGLNGVGGGGGSATSGHLARTGTLLVNDYSDPDACNWVAVSSEPWLTITANGSGPGTKTLEWAVTENTGPERSATIKVTIDGAPFTVTQGPHPDAEVLVGSIADARFGDDWTLDGQYLTDTRAKLLDAANFGAGGTVARSIAIDDVGETPGSLDLQALDAFEVFFIGYFNDASANAFTASELEALRNWVMSGGHLIVTCDEPAYDAVCSSLGFPIGGEADPPAAPVGAFSSHPLFDGPFGTVTSFQMAGDHSFFATTTGADVLAVDPSGNPVMLQRHNTGCGTVTLLSDVDILSNDTLSDGSGIDTGNPNDILLGNLFAWLGGLGERASCDGFETAAGATAQPWYGADIPKSAIETSPVIPATVSAIFEWDSVNQLFDFWFRGFPDAFNTLADGLKGRRVYFFQSPGGAVIDVSALPGPSLLFHAPFQTQAGATGHLWTGGHIALVDMETGLPPEVSAVFRWSNSAQAFEFWFRGFPPAFQTLTRGIRWVEYYFFQSATAGITIGN